MTVALAVAILALVAFVVYRDLLWEQRVSKVEIKAERDVARSRAETAAERDRAAAERKELYQRIQAPEIAVAEAHRERVGDYKPRKPIGADDDAAYVARDKARREKVSEDV